MLCFLRNVEVSLQIIKNYHSHRLPQIFLLYSNKSHANNGNWNYIPHLGIVAVWTKNEIGKHCWKGKTCKELANYIYKNSDILMQDAVLQAHWQEEALKLLKINKNKLSR